MPLESDPSPAAGGLDPSDLEVTLRVLAQLDEIDETHPDFIAVRQATAKMFKAVKQTRRLAARAEEQAADRAVVAATATGAADRIDDETRGIPISTSSISATAGTLRKPRACYICKKDYTQVDAFYHQLCPDCAAISHAKRDAHTDLTGKRALLTGGRAKIGMYIALRLLRDGAHTTITTRFPRDAVRRFTSLPAVGLVVVDARLAASACPAILLQQMTLSLGGDLTLIVPRFSSVGTFKVVSADGLPHTLSIKVEGKTSLLNDILLAPGATADPLIKVKLQTPGSVFVLGTSSLNASASTGGVIATTGAVTLG